MARMFERIGVPVIQSKMKADEVLAALSLSGALAVVALMTWTQSCLDPTTPSDEPIFARRRRWRASSDESHTSPYLGTLASAITAQLKQLRVRNEGRGCVAWCVEPPGVIHVYSCNPDCKNSNTCWIYYTTTYTA